MDEVAQKYSFYIVNFENFSMDVPGAHTFVGGDGYHSKDGMILCNFNLGRYTPQLNTLNSDNSGPQQANTSAKSYIYNNWYRVDCY